LLLRLLRVVWAADGGNGWTGGLNHGFVITAYLEDIDEQGGCFTYWRGSHNSVHEYFRRYPSQIDGSFGTADTVSSFTFCVCLFQACPGKTDRCSIDP
jgi:hypothetical protein